MRYITNRFDKGIVRAMSANIATTGMLDEAINLRNKAGSLKICGGKEVVKQGIQFDKAILHKGATFSNLITISGSDVIWLQEDNTEVVIYQGSGEVYVSTINAMLIINDSGADSLIVYIFKSDSYSLFFDKFPALPGLSFTKELTQSSSSFVKLPIADIKSNATKLLAKNTLIGLFNEALRGDDYKTRGWLLVSLNFTLFDGSETKMSPPQLISLVGGRVTSQTDNAVNFFTYQIHAGAPDEKTAHASVGVYSLALKFADIPDYTAYTDLIRSINIYVTNPVCDVNATEDDITLSYNAAMTDYAAPFNMKSTKYGNSIFEKQLFYRQYSVDIKDINTTEKYRIKFGDYLLGGKTMEVDSSGWISTVGIPYVYNNRLHLYGIKRTFEKSQQIFDAMSNPDEDSIDATAYVYLKTEAGDIVVKGTIKAKLEPGNGDDKYLILNDFVSYPDSRAYKIVVTIYYPILQQTYMGVISLISSTTYNFSFAIRRTDIPGNCAISESSFSTTETLSYFENNTIIVSEQNNPAFFSIANSYRIQGNIKDIAVMAEQISETQTGQFPLFVFTDSGIYALQQGSGNVLYAFLTPINSDKVLNSVKQTKSGIAYIANNRVYLLAGRQSAPISAALEGDYDSSIRNNESYNKATNNAQLCVSSALLSEVRFEEYLKNAIILYTHVENELIISNANYNYSYVFAINSGAWHKISEVFVSESSDFGVIASELTTVDKPAQAAKAVFTIQNLITANELVFASQAKVVFANANTLIQPSSVLLKLNNEIIASATLMFSTPLYVVLELLLKNNSNYAVEYSTVTHECSVYNDNTNIINKVLTLTTATGVTMSDDFAANSASVTIARKGINESISLTINESTLNIAITSIMSITDLLSQILQQMQALNLDFTAQIVNNTIIIVCNTVGPGGNSNNLSATSSKYCIVSVSNFQGGANQSEEIIPAGRSLIDINAETAGERLIHLQTRPFSLEQTGFKRIKSALRGIVFPAEDKIIGIYIFASNDLQTWSLIEAGQLNRTFSLVALQRSRSSFRYFTLVVCGIVDTATEITHLDCEVHDVFANKLR